MLHAGAGMTINAKINSRGNKEQHAAIRGGKTIWGGGSLNATRRGVIVSNSHLIAKTHTTVNFFEFY